MIIFSPIAIIFFLLSKYSVNSFPIGVNLSPLGGSLYSINWDAPSTNVFIDLYKHCSTMYIRSTSNAGISYGYQSNTQVSWTTDGYPASLPHYSNSQYLVAMCDIGFGGNFLRNGTYQVMWDGTGDVIFGGNNVKTVSHNVTQKFSTVHFNIFGNSGVKVIISKSSAEDPVHNVRIVPIAYIANYTTQIFQPSFLNIIRPFQNIRFTGWQKITTSAKTWSSRTLTTFQTQHGSDGVAIEHMIDLINIMGDTLTSVWFSFPLSSSDYNSQMIELLSDSLPPNITIYYESGCAEVHGDSDRHLDSLELFQLFDDIMTNTTYTRMPTAVVYNIAYAPYLLSRFGVSGMLKLKAVALPGQFGRSPFSWDSYNSYGEWSIAYANYTTSNLLKEIRRSSLVGELMINRMKGKFLSSNPNIIIIAYTGGPYLNSGSYTYRAGMSSVLSCAKALKFPCVWYNAKYNFTSQAAINAALPMMRYNSSLEQVVEDNFVKIERDPMIQEIYLDFLERWNRLGGGLFVAGSFLVKVPVRCPYGGKSCGSGGMLESSLYSDCPNCPKYLPLVLYQQGVRTALQFTSADAPAATKHVCTPGCTWGTCFNGTCTCFAGYTGKSCTIKTAKPNDCTNDTGINPSSIADWSTEWSFVDIFKGSRPWISQDFMSSAWSTGTVQHIMPNGYPKYLLPTQTLGSMMIRDVKNHMRSGTYICLYDGDGILTFGMDIVKVVYGVGRIEVTIKLTNGLNNGVFLSIERTNPDDPIRNIRFVMPGFESKYAYFPFHPLFLHTISSYTTIRFMGWSNTNSVTYGNWSQRSTENTTRTYSWDTNAYENIGPGVSIEMMVLLANTVGAAPWFNMPHLCTDDFITNFANLVKSSIRPDVKIYVEYSNEVWGTLFPGGIYAQQQGLKMGLSTGATTARFCFYVLRSSQIFKIWKSVFGSDSERLVFVLASQAVNPDATRQILACSGVEEATAVAIAPYFGTYSSSKDTNLNVFMNTTLPKQIAAMSSTITGHLKWAKKYNLTLITYESGQGMQGSGKSTDLAIQANRDSRMADLYVQYYSMLRSAGVKLMMQFDSVGLFSTSACWGLIEATDMSPAESPKYRGIQSYIDLHKTCSAVADNGGVTCPNSCTSPDSGYCTSSGTCECYYGYSGASCQTGQYTEHTDLCGYYCGFSQGVCVVDYVSGMDRYWKCDCDEGYYGTQCTLFACKHSCNYNGICLDIDVCSCYPGYSGSFCDVDCGCNGHGTCSSDKKSCVCDVGWTWSAASSSCIATCSSGSCSDGGKSTCSDCAYGSCLDGTCVCWAGYSGSSCNISIPRANTDSIIGVNVGGLSYYGREWVFVDAMKTSSDWVSLNYPGMFYTNTWGNGMTIHLRPDGYPAFLLPGQVLARLVLRDVGLHAPNGRYVCLYDGDGVISFGMDSSILTTGKGRIEFYFKPTTVVGCTAAYCSDNGIYMTIYETNVSNPLRNIRIIMPGFEFQYESLPFHPWYLKNIEHFATIRFMGWQNINGHNKEISWSNRTLPTYADQTGSVALEHMIQLSNVLGANPWFCMPHQADDDYIQNFAAMVKDSLRPDLKIYIEYSNEVWNTLFSQGTYAQTMGIKLGLSTNVYDAQYRYYSQRSVEIFKIWESVFGSSSRLVRVLATFTISAAATTTIVTWKDAYKHADMIAVAPYFDCGGLGSSSKAPLAALMTVTKILAACTADMPNVAPYITKIAKIAKKYNLTIGSYEAGQSLVEYNVMAYGTGETSGLTNLFIGANRAPGMKAVYTSYLNTVYEAGLMSSHPLMQFTSGGAYTKYGSWGVIEYTGQPYETSYKLQALREFIDNKRSVDFGSCRVTSDTTTVLGLGLEDSSYFGFPAVVSPRSGDVWITGYAHSVKWDAYGGPATQVSIHLWKDAYCGDPNSNNYLLQLAARVSRGLGKYSVTIPYSSAINTSSNYFIEIRGSVSSNFSDFFHIRPEYFYNSESHCCSDQITYELTNCTHYVTSERSNALLVNSSWSKAGKLSSCSTVFSGWHTQSCTIDTNGCRAYRTTAHFKPVTDCVAQYSAFPQNSTFITDLVVRVLPTSDQCYTISPVTSGGTCDSNISAIDPFCLLTRHPTRSPLKGPPTRTPIASPTKFPSRSPTFRPSPVPTEFPTSRPSRVPSETPTSRPTRDPTSSPTRRPSQVPTSYPTRKPTIEPTSRPTPPPTELPSRRPSQNPTLLPSRIPSRLPTFVPSRRPTVEPTLRPSRGPTLTPTRIPSRSPSSFPTTRPSTSPSAYPTRRPTSLPTNSPTKLPSAYPTRRPTSLPTNSPTKLPSAYPTKRPTTSPTPFPTRSPSTSYPSRAPSSSRPTRTTAIPVSTN